jgi:hypothetical protein
MSNTDTNVQGESQLAGPNPDLRTLDRLIGTWKVTGGAQGTERYEWMEGGYFLIHRFDFDHGGHQVKGMEIIGHLHPFGEAPSADIKTRSYDTMGNTLDYVYEISGDTLMIWGGERGSPAYFKGTFSADGNTCAGAWVYPDGGGYASTMTRVREN